MNKDTIKFYRMRVEWGKIEPEEGLIDESAIVSYRRKIKALKKEGEKILLTIYDFRGPEWFEEKGSFTKKQNVDYFLHYVSVVVRAFGDLVSEYVTMEQPNVYVFSNYSFSKAALVMSILAFCHARAYDKIHRMRLKLGFTDTKVGVFQWMKNSLMQEFVNKAYFKGVFHLPLRNYGKIEKGTYCDFIGITYLEGESSPREVRTYVGKCYDILQAPIYMTDEKNEEVCYYYADRGSFLMNLW